MADALARLAIASGKLARAALLIARRGATAAPGVVALTIDPDLVGSLSATLPHGVAAISGTNGKTTTARMVSDIARAAGWAPVHNRSGSNLERGIAATLVAETTWRGDLRADIGVYEVDEASLPRVLRRFAPRVVLVGNLFRDQLDRYYEIDALAKRIGAAVAALPESSTLVLNADDPIVARLAPDRTGPTIYYGIDDPTVGGAVPQATSDATRCPRCRAPLAYARVVLAHVGDWSCPSCGLARPARELSAVRVQLDAGSTELRLGGLAGAVLDPVRVPLPGLYNAYNVLAALAVARALDIALPTATRALATFRPAFGRLEEVSANGRTLRLVLVKNPAGFDAAIGALLETRRHPRLLAALNDRDADGRDVSWIWDADFETLAPLVEHAVVTGIRARDLALRFKYAGVPRDRVELVDDRASAVDRAIAACPEGGEVVVLATYTAMLELRAALTRLGHVGKFWED